MRHSREPQTRQEIEAEIQYQRDIISECDRCVSEGETWNFEGRDFKEVIQTASDKIQVLRDRLEFIARPWERIRPQHEVYLSKYGVIV